MPPLVSVVIPAYNAARFLGAAVRSALEQTYREIEVIVVNDGSTDGTEGVLRAFGGSITVARQQNAGPSRARNRGIELSSGRYIAFLDADDEWEKRKLEVQIDRLERDASLVASAVGVVHVDTATDRRTYVPPRRSPELLKELLLHGTVLGPTSALVVRRAALERIGHFDPATDQVEDLDLEIRLAELGRIDVIEEPLVRYRVHGANSSRNARRMEVSALAALDKFFSVPANLERYRSVRRSSYGNLNLIFAGAHLRTGDVLSSLRCLARAVAYRPANLLPALAMPVRRLQRRLSP